MKIAIYGYGKSIYMFEGGEKKVAKRLWDSMFEKAYPYMVTDCYRNEEAQVLECRARLAVLKEV